MGEGEEVAVADTERLHLQVELVRKVQCCRLSAIPGHKLFLYHGVAAEGTNKKRKLGEGKDGMRMASGGCSTPPTRRTLYGKELNFSIQGTVSS